MVVLFPIAFPISILLDKLFGHEEDSPDISRNELEALMRLQNTKSLKINEESLETSVEPSQFSCKAEESTDNEQSTEKDLTGEEVVD